MAEDATQDFTSLNPCEKYEEGDAGSEMFLVQSLFLKVRPKTK
jgi:hypothetical protein